MQTSNARAFLPDSRAAGGKLASKYGLRLLEKIKVIDQAVPTLIPADRRLKIVSQISELPLESASEILRDMEQLAPRYKEEIPCVAAKEIIGPPVTHCLNGCLYRIGEDKGTPVVPCWQRDPTQALLYTLDGKTIDLGILTLRCSSCECRFGYQAWGKAGQYRLYDQERKYFDHSTYEGIAATFQNSYAGFRGFTRKIVSTAFLRYEIECDLTEKGKRGFIFTSGKGLFQYIPHEVPHIFSSIYSHGCSEPCCARGCGTLYTADGLWKVGFRHCKATVTNTVNNVRLVCFPNVCTSACNGRSEYCKEHKWMEATEEANSIDANLGHVLIPGSDTIVAVADINALLSAELDNGVDVYDCTDFNPDKQCIKNKGVDGRSYVYSRGYIFVVGSNGCIEAFAPIFRAESLGQVFLFIIAWLYQRLQTVPRDQWHKLFLAYDNMCQLNRLKATKEKLPLPEPYNAMWAEISKVVDGLHIKNHKDPRCKVVYSPDLYYEEHPEMKTLKCRNTMSAEQTFAWLANFRKQINAMPKDRQIFFIHRLIVRRNKYLSDCVASSVKPVGGVARTFAQKGNRQ